MTSEIKWRQNCILCANGLSLRIWSFLGYSCFKLNCIHAKKISLYQFRFCKLRLIFSLFFASYIYSVCVIDIYYSFGKSINFNDLIRLATDNLHAFNTSLLITIGIVNTKLRMNLYKILTMLLKDTELAGMEPFITIKDIKISRTSSYLCLSIYLCFFLLFILSWKSMVTTNLFNLNKLFVSIICSYFDIGVIFGYALEVFTLKKLFKRCFYELKKKVSEIKINKKIAKEKNTNYFRKYQEIHSSLVRAHKIFQKSSQGNVLPWFCATLATLTFNAYLLLKKCLDGQPLNFEDMLLEGRLLLTISVNAVIISVIDKLAAVVSKILSIFLK